MTFAYWMSRASRSRRFWAAEEGVGRGRALCADTCTPSWGDFVKPLVSRVETDRDERRGESLERKLERRGSRVHSQYQQLHSE